MYFIFPLIIQHSSSSPFVICVEFASVRSSLANHECRFMNSTNHAFVTLLLRLVLFWGTECSEAIHETSVRRYFWRTAAQALSSITGEVGPCIIALLYARLSLNRTELGLQHSRHSRFWSTRDQPVFEGSGAAETFHIVLNSRQI